MRRPPVWRGDGKCPETGCDNFRAEGFVYCARHDSKLALQLYCGLEAYRETVVSRLGSRLAEHIDDVLSHLWCRLSADDVGKIVKHREREATR